jgi:hypothetical protein
MSPRPLGESRRREAVEVMPVEDVGAGRPCRPRTFGSGGQQLEYSRVNRAVRSSHPGTVAVGGRRRLIKVGSVASPADGRGRLRTGTSMPRTLSRAASLRTISTRGMMASREMFRRRCRSPRVPASAISTAEGKGHIGAPPPEEPDDRYGSSTASSPSPTLAARRRARQRAAAIVFQGLFRVLDSVRAPAAPCWDACRKTRPA